MAKFSASDAVGAGFALIRRRPLSVFAWGLFAVLVVYGPLIPTAGSIVASYVDLMQVSMHPGATPDVSRVMAVEMRFFQAMAWMWPLGLIAAAINLAAVFRAVLEPNNRGFASLRIGMQEVWLLVLMFVQALLAMLFMAAAGLVIALACVVAARFGGAAMAIIVGVATGFVSVILFFWIWLRLSLAAPMTFSARKLQVFGSWRLTRGSAGQLLLTALLLAAIMFGIGLVAQVIEGVGFAFFDPYSANPEAVRAWFARPPAPAVWAPWLAVGAVVMAVYIGVVRAVLSAPWAAAYRALAGEA